ncbi:hypothetical protein C8K36_10560 [Rhodococcus sp. OK519]|uniref:hypothetical protein n=1 Tax=Rhodococcus sp. OK519 TaxID=2135729 RepID=UPI000D403817|nr:hypothetical protein C8K36_10560 [Rhodococcus sp. OK519]
MPRGSGMSPTRRRNRKPTGSSPEALAARLPDDLRSLEGVGTPSEYQALRGHVADWLDHAAPGQGQVQASAVMTAAGLSAAEFYRIALEAGQKQAGPSAHNQGAPHALRNR